MVVKGRKLFRAIRVEDTVSVKERVQDWKKIKEYSLDMIEDNKDYSFFSPFLTYPHLRNRKVIERTYGTDRIPFDLFHPRCVQYQYTHLKSISRTKKRFATMSFFLMFL